MELRFGAEGYQGGVGGLVEAGHLLDHQLRVADDMEVGIAPPEACAVFQAGNQGGVFGHVVSDLCPDVRRVGPHGGAVCGGPSLP